MQSSVHEPLNLGCNQLVTINRLVDMVEATAGVKLRRRYKLDARRASGGATATISCGDWPPGEGCFRRGPSRHLPLPRRLPQA
jgi:hypothetical protein